jgi:hypothetical protein
MNTVDVVSRTERARRASEVARQNVVRRGTRRTGSPATADRDYDRDELEFMRAIQEWQLRTGRKFPSWSEVLGVLKGLGYERPRTS